MKKSKKIGLSLNKKVVSSLQKSLISGGSGGCPRGTNGTCTCAPSQFPDCNSNNCTSRADCNHQ